MIRAKKKVNYDTDSIGKVSDDLCKYIGLKIKSRRSALEIGQEGLAKALDLSCQQIQKYEKGANRISTTTLYHISKILNVNVDYFFSGFDGEHLTLSEEDNAPFAEYEEKLMLPETMDLISEYYSIEDRDVRRDIISLIKLIKKTSDKFSKK